MRVISGAARRIPLKAPKGLDTRPTLDQVKEAIFSVIQFEVEGRRVLDLFAGSGQMGIEALSRGAQSAVFVDAGREACAVVKENLAKTRLTEQAQVICADWRSYLKTCKRTFDLVFLDPPYAGNFMESALKSISEIDILSDSGIIICEQDSSAPLLGDFDGLTRCKTYHYGRAAVTIYRR